VQSMSKHGIEPSPKLLNELREPMGSEATIWPPFYTFAEVWFS
jgi:hypothetical protein